MDETDETDGAGEVCMVWAVNVIVSRSAFTPLPPFASIIL